MRYIVLSITLLFCIPFSYAETSSDSSSYTDEKLITCMQSSVGSADESMSVKDLKKACKFLLEQKSTGTNELNSAEKSALQSQVQNKSTSPLEIESKTVPAKNENASSKESSQRHLLQDRLTMEALNRSNRFILTPHKRNFLLPVSYSDSPNTEPYKKANNADTDLNHTEAELQLSVKILLRENIFDNNGHLYLGYTDHALWQVYNRRLSAPFRETDHQPELILSFTNDMEIFGFHNILNEGILNHQSNGQSGLLSRSWNRLMFNTVFEKNNLAFAFMPWYRLPEDKSEYPGDPSGDDNPDISHYMGHFELSGAYKYKSDIFSIMLRNNLESDNRGAVEASWTFPVTKTMRGYLNYFDGYGHSLIDYNKNQQVVGLGIIFTDLF